MTGETTEPDTLAGLLLRNSEERGDRPAIREKRRGIWQTFTWSELADEVASLALALSQRDLRRGAHVVVLGNNHLRLFATMCAAHALGAVAVPLHEEASAREIAPTHFLATPRVLATTAGSVPATSATWTATGICGSSTARATPGY